MTHTVRVIEGESFDARSDESLLAAAARAGVHYSTAALKEETDENVNSGWRRGWDCV